MSKSHVRPFLPVGLQIAKRNRLGVDDPLSRRFGLDREANASDELAAEPARLTTAPPRPAARARPQPQRGSLAFASNCALHQSILRWSSSYWLPS